MTGKVTKGHWKIVRPSPVTKGRKRPVWLITEKSSPVASWPYSRPGSPNYDPTNHQLNLNNRTKMKLLTSLFIFLLISIMQPSSAFCQRKQTFDLQHLLQKKGL